MPCYLFKCANMSTYAPLRFALPNIIIASAAGVLRNDLHDPIGNIFMVFVNRPNITWARTDLFADYFRDFISQAFHATAPIFFKSRIIRLASR